MPLPRFDFRALPVGTSEDAVENERRYRAEVERSLLSGDAAFRQIERLIAEMQDQIDQLIIDGGGP